MIDARTPDACGVFDITELPPRWLFRRRPDDFGYQFRFRAEERIAMSARSPRAFVGMFFL